MVDVEKLKKEDIKSEDRKNSVSTLEDRCGILIIAL